MGQAMHPMVLLTMMLGLVGAVGVIQLDTASFEGTTQAATGQTTGIWLVHFRSADCPPCDDTTAIMARYDPAAFHGVAIRMAEVDVDRNRALFKRFQMLQVPAIVLFRNRHMYVYPHNPLADTQESSLEAMVAFAQQTYASSAELAVPGPGSPVDNVMEKLGLLQRYIDTFILRHKTALFAQLNKYNVSKELAAGIVGGLLTLFSIVRRFRGRNKKRTKRD